MESKEEKRIPAGKHALYRWCGTTSLKIKWTEATEEEKLGISYIAGKIKLWAAEHCKKWAFQLEAGAKEGIAHFQVAISLKDKLRQVDLVRLVNKSDCLRGTHWTPMSVLGDTSGGAWNYCFKAEGIAGPWSDETESKPIPADIKDCDMKPWQKFIHDDLTRPWTKEDGRRVNVLVDGPGNAGKSWLMKYMRHHRLATVVPPFADEKDMSAAIMSMRAAGIFLFPHNLIMPLRALRVRPHGCLAS